MPNSVGENIKELRSARKMTQAELADKILVNKSTVSSYENGARQPSYSVLVRIARLFNVTTDDLLGLERRRQLQRIHFNGDAEQEKGDHDRSPLDAVKYVSIENLTDKQKAMIINMIEELNEKNGFPPDVDFQLDEL